VQLLDGHAYPVRRPDLNHGIDGQVDELAPTQANGREQLDAQAHKRIGVRPRRAEELGGCGVVQEAWQGFVENREVTAEQQRSGQNIVARPLGQADERYAESFETAGDRTTAVHSRTAPAASNPRGVSSRMRAMSYVRPWRWCGPEQSRWRVAQ
jgi:hypothetical protein